RISGVSMEWHGSWSSVRGSAEKGDTWSNDGKKYDINDFVADGKKAKAAGISVLYWNSDMNGSPHDAGHLANWTSRTITVFSGDNASANKARLGYVLDI